MAALEAYEGVFSRKYHTMMAHKLGLDEVRAEDTDLIGQVVETLAVIKPDMTIFYQRLADLPVDESADEQAVVNHFNDSFYRELDGHERRALHGLIGAYLERIKRNTCTREVSVARMRESNPRFILRNYLLHQAIEELERGENGLFLKLQEAIKNPYGSKFDEFFAKRPEWASHQAGCSMLSCSS